MLVRISSSATYISRALRCVAVSCDIISCSYRHCEDHGIIYTHFLNCMFILVFIYGFLLLTLDLCTCGLQECLDIVGLVKEEKLVWV